MKVFVLALVVLAVTSGFVWWSSWYVVRMCNGILCVLENMADLEKGDFAGFGSGYREIERIWEKGEVCLHLLVGHDAADAVRELMKEMGMRYIGKDALGYQVCREKLCQQVEKIREGECIVVDSIM